MQHWCLAVDRVRHVGEPVAVALAPDRHTAQDALERIAVRYRPLPPVVAPEKAAEPDAPLLHPEVGSNVVSDRAFRYGDPEAAFVAAAHGVSVTTRYPRNAASPLECFVVIAEYLPGEAAYEVIANFQGPFAMHPVMAMALGVPGNRLRLRTPPHSGGSFGAKHAVFPYIVLLALAAREAGRPVKWVESRLEHLIAATSATNRVTTLSAAVDRDGVVTALAWDQAEDCGAYLRAPEPATLYRMHANMTGAYRVRHLSIRNRVVLANKTPSGLVRGFGGPPDATHRRDPRARSAGSDPAQSGSGISAPLSGRRNTRFGRLSGCNPCRYRARRRRPISSNAGYTTRAEPSSSAGRFPTPFSWPATRWNARG